MNALDLDRLFLDCPYPVRKDGEEYSFKTDYLCNRFKYIFINLQSLDTAKVLKI